MLPPIPKKLTKILLLDYYDTVFRPALDDTRLAYHHLHAPGAQWRARLDSLAQPEDAPIPRRKAPAKDSRMEKTHDSQVRQAKRNFEIAQQKDADYRGSGKDAAAQTVFFKLVQQREKFEAAKMARDNFHRAHTAAIEQWEHSSEAYKPVAAYRDAISTLARELATLASRFNEWFKLDQPVTTRTVYMNGYGKYVPSHHLYRANVAGGTYIYAFETNQMDVHFHCSTYNGKVTLVTFKKWNSSFDARNYNTDGYFSDKAGLVENPPTLKGVNQAFISLVAYLRKTCPPIDEPTPTHVAPPLPRHRGE